MNHVLYYPYINVPRTKWTLRALTYYDTIGSIVPQEFIWEPERYYEPFMLTLVREGFVVPIDPINALERPWEIGGPFLELVQSDEFALEQKRNAFRDGNWGGMHQDKFVGHRIHADKFVDSLYYSLDQIGLAKRRDGNWYDVEKTTAGLLMEYLASVLSVKLDRRATTDKIPTGRFGNKSLARENQRRKIVLKNLIPFPREIDFGKLLDFKLKHQNLLAAFRTEVEDIVLDISIDEGSELFNNRIQRLKLRKNELSDRMNESKIKDLILGSVCGIVGAGIGILTAGNGWGALGALPGFINAVHSALKIETPEKVPDQSGMKYLALMDKRLGFSRPPQFE